MKKTYNIPTLTVVKIQPAHILAGSNPRIIEGGTDATGGNAGRRGRFSGWEEDDFE